MLKNSVSAMLDFWEAYERGIQKISWGTSQFVDWAACAVLNRSKMVLSGDVPSNCSLASFRHARFFDFFNEIGQDRKHWRAIPKGRSKPRRAVVRKLIGQPRDRLHPIMIGYWNLNRELRAGFRLLIGDR